MSYKRLIGVETTSCVYRDQQRLKNYKDGKYYLIILKTGKAAIYFDNKVKILVANLVLLLLVSKKLF